MKHNAASFIKLFNQRHYAKVKIIPKQKSILMKLCNFCLTILNALGITSIKWFMTAYVTTIGSRIYYPNATLQSIEVSPVLVHELTHVLEHKYYTLYSLKYLLSARCRAYYESLCVQTELLCFPYRQKGFNVDLESKRFIPYGIPQDLMQEQLHKRFVELDHKFSDDNIIPHGISITYNLWQQEDTTIA